MISVSPIAYDNDISSNGRFEKIIDFADQLTRLEKKSRMQNKINSE